MFETLALSYAMTHFDWSSLKSGMTVSYSGAFGVLILLNFSVILRITSDMNLAVIGIVLMGISCVLLVVSESPPQWAFYLSLSLMYAVGYPIGQTAVLGLFSKVLKAGQSLSL